MYIKQTPKSYWRGKTDYNRAYWKDRSTYFRDAANYLAMYGIEVNYEDGLEIAEWMDESGFRLFPLKRYSREVKLEVQDREPIKYENRSIPFQYEQLCKDFIIVPHLLDPNSLETKLAPTLLDDSGQSTRGSLLFQLTRAGPGVFSLPIFQKEFCKQLFQEVKRISSECNLPLDNNGLHLSYFGFTPLFQRITTILSENLTSRVHPEANLVLTSAFIVYYSPGDSHVIHDDDSDLTININLGEEGFEGGNLIIEVEKDDDDNNNNNNNHYDDYYDNNYDDYYDNNYYDDYYDNNYDNQSRRMNGYLRAKKNIPYPPTT